MAKYITLIFAFFSISTLSLSQSNYQDVVYLKNGSIIRGIIIERIPNKSITIETPDSNTFVFQIDEIGKFTKEPRKRKRINSLRSIGLPSGYKLIIKSGYQSGIAEYGSDRLKLDIINGYQFNPYISCGFGTGLRYYFDTETLLLPYFNTETLLLPLFADFRVNFIDNKVSPNLSLGIGYSFDITNDFANVGLLINPEIGVSYKISEKSAMNLGLGYEMQKMQKMSVLIYNLYNIDKFTGNSGAVSINLGFSF